MAWWARTGYYSGDDLFTHNNANTEIWNFVLIMLHFDKAHFVWKP